MGAGPYDHPSYITRQQIRIGATTAGANGTSGRTAFTNQMRLRNVTGVVQVAGTSDAPGHAVTIRSGTTSLGVLSFGTAAINGTATSGDLNTILAAGAVLNFLNGTDATGVANITAEMHTDPSGTWVGNG